MKCCHVGQPIQHALAVVAGQVHPHEIGQLALLRWHDAVQGAEDGQGEASVGQAVLSAAAHVDALAGAVEIPLLQLEDQRREPGGGGIVLVHIATEAALQGGAVVAFEARLGSMALQAQGLQLLLLPGERLGHRDDVIDLEGPHSDGRATELANQQLFPPAPGTPRRSVHCCSTCASSQSSGASILGNGSTLQITCDCYSKSESDSRYLSTSDFGPLDARYFVREPFPEGNGIFSMVQEAFTTRIIRSLLCQSPLSAQPILATARPCR